MTRKKKEKNLHERLIALFERDGATEEEIAALFKKRKLSKGEARAEKIRRLKEYIDLANKLSPNQFVIDIADFLREEANADPPFVRTQSGLPPPVMPPPAPARPLAGDRPLPPPVRLPRRQPKIKLPEEHTPQSWVLKFRVLLIYLERFPHDFREYILGDAAESFNQLDTRNLSDDANISHLSNVYGALQRYDEFRTVREKLRKIIRLKDITNKWMTFRPRTIPSHSTLRVNDAGIFESTLDAFAEAIEGLEADKIRECPVCGRIFWADRVDKTCCSKPCSNVYNVRRYRGQRSENRKHKRQVAKLKKGV